MFQGDLVSPKLLFFSALLRRIQRFLLVLYAFGFDIVDPFIASLFVLCRIDARIDC